jgi:hypothetical protein
MAIDYSEWFEGYLRSIDKTFKERLDMGMLDEFEHDANTYGLKHAIKLLYTNAHHDGNRFGSNAKEQG